MALSVVQEQGVLRDRTLERGSVYPTRGSVKLSGDADSAGANCKSFMSVLHTTAELQSVSFPRQAGAISSEPFSFF